MRGRPELRTSYGRDQAIFDTNAKRFWFGVLMVALLWLPFVIDRELNLIMAGVFAAAIGAIGLNLVSGYAGQISLGHAFFIGIGAYTGAVLGGDPEGRLVGFGIDNVLILLLAAGLVPALIGAVVAPLATRVRGLYLAIVTLGLVFLGEHIFGEAEPLTGGAGVGRSAPRPELFGFEFTTRGEVFGVHLGREQRFYLLALVTLIVLGFLAKNLARSRVGRAFTAVRDRDIAAEVMGVNLSRTKLTAFTVSSFYAGVTGFLTSIFTGFIEPGNFNLLLSIEYVVMVIIGGIATMTGSILGAAFIVLLPRFVQVVPDLVPFISAQPTGGVLNVFQLQAILYGVLLIAFVVLEPRGLYGLWVRVRNYFRAWPFSY